MYKGRKYAVLSCKDSERTPKGPSVEKNILSKGTIFDLPDDLLVKFLCKHRPGIDADLPCKTVGFYCRTDVAFSPFFQF